MFYIYIIFYSLHVVVYIYLTHKMSVTYLSYDTPVKTFVHFLDDMYSLSPLVSMRGRLRHHEQHLSLPLDAKCTLCRGPCFECKGYECFDHRHLLCTSKQHHRKARPKASSKEIALVLHTSWLNMSGCFKGTT